MCSHMMKMIEEGGRGLRFGGQVVNERGTVGKGDYIARKRLEHSRTNGDKEFRTAVIGGITFA